MRRFLGLSVLGMCALLPAPAALAQYRFTSVAEFAPDPFVFMQEPPINAEGEVAFMHPDPGARPDAQGLYLWHEGHVRTLVPAGFADARGRSLSDEGRAAFVSQVDGKVYRVGHRGQPTLIAVPDPYPAFGFYAPSINNRGTVAFIAGLDEDGNTAVFAGRGGQVQTVSDSTTGTLNFHSPPVVNNRDIIAFSAYDTTTQISSVYFYRDGALSRIYDNGTAPALNDRGVVAFTRYGVVPGSTTVFRGNGGPLATIADSAGPLVHVFATGINERGAVALFGTHADGSAAVYTGDGRHLRPVVSAGDTVLGRTVARVAPASINDRGALAMHVRFSDDSSAIVVARPRD